MLRGLTLCCALYSALCMSAQNARAERFEVRGESVTLTPQLSLSSSYDSNVFYEAEQEPNGSVPNTGWMMKLGGGLQLNNRHRSSVELDLKLSMAYRHYLDIDDESGRVSQAVIDNRNALDFIKGDGYALFGVQSPLKFKLAEQLNYIERPAYENTIFGFERLSNRSRALAIFSPGGGGAQGGPLSISAGYELFLVTFLNSKQSIQIQGRSEMVAHSLLVETKWRFLPKNFLIFDLKFGAHDYNNFEPLEGQSEDAEALSRDSTPLRVQVGVTGLLSPRTSIFLKGGYTNTYNKNGETYSGPIALAELSYHMEPRFKVSLGYQRDARDSGFSNYFTLNRLFAKGRLKLSQRVSIAGNLSYDVYDYSPSNSPGEVGREDPVTRGQLNLNLPVSGQLRAQLGWSIEVNASSYATPVEEDLPKTDFAKYHRQLFTLSLLFN
jgi:hypothetical protein